MSEIKHFLLAYDHGQDRLLEQQEFGTDVNAATTAYTKLERQYKESTLVDIVLVGSDSIESVRVTHSNYFEGGTRNKIAEMLQVSPRA